MNSVAAGLPGRSYVVSIEAPACGTTALPRSVRMLQPAFSFGLPGIGPNGSNDSSTSLRRSAKSARRDIRFACGICESDPEAVGGPVGCAVGRVAGAVPRAVGGSGPGGVLASCGAGGDRQEQASSRRARRSAGARPLDCSDHKAVKCRTDDQEFRHRQRDISEGHKGAHDTD